MNIFEKIKYTFGKKDGKKVLLTRRSLRKIILKASETLSEKEYEYFCKEFNDKYDYSSITNMDKLFEECKTIKRIPHLDTKNVLTMSKMFASCYSLKEIPLLDTKNVCDMSEMFSLCYSLETIPELNMDNVLTTYGMFEHCTKLKTLKIKNIPNLLDGEGMFYNCIALRRVSFENILPKLKYTSFMFQKCKRLRKRPITLNNVKQTIINTNTYQGCDLLEKLETHRENKKQKNKTRVKTPILNQIKTRDIIMTNNENELKKINELKEKKEENLRNLKNNNSLINELSL